MQCKRSRDKLLKREEDQISLEETLEETLEEQVTKVSDGASHKRTRNKKHNSRTEMTLEQPVPESLTLLDELYHCVLSADCPSLTSTRSACLLRSCLCAHGAGASAPEPGSQTLPSQTVSSPELQCVGLTVLEQLLCRLTEGKGGPDFHLFAEETWRLLQSDVLGTLLQQFDSEDNLVSHLSVMCVSAAVLYHLHHGSISAEWSQWCLQALRTSPGPPVDACVRSLTEVLRRLLKGGQHELTDKVLAEFDSSLSAFCPLLLSVDTGAGCGGWGVSMSLVVDLLEPALRRRILVLLKKALVQRAGEDWTGGHSGLRCSDICLLAESVLRVVSEGVLRGIHMEGGSFFGGTRTGGSGPSVDNVTLRACVSSCSGPWSCSVNRVSRSLSDILPVDPLAPPSGINHHCCSRLSSVFGEQDDDMMEAAKALLCIYLHHRQQETSPAPLPLWACSLGLNPHCHFLLLLRSLAFDHRVLLDFLISTETCFLEYFVRYLRLLRTDPEGFSAACSSLEVQPRTEMGNRGSVSTECALGAGQQCEVLLVDYSSSGESDTEDVERTVDTDKAQDKDTLLESAVRCLSLLLELVSRLHSKKLFPYNPNSLMKLLTETQELLI
ncbi:hypothetical protein WMY93_013186 [Mugilogobius chulae]|uniref:Lines homolog 1 n=1 Tax=Mugilogobius chulae TaxID=88201 RepID=A0AAW0P8G6_9GOBI